MKKMMLVVVCLAAALAAGAQQLADTAARHQVRVGWGDALFEARTFDNTTPHIYPNPMVLPEGFIAHERFNSFCTGHLFLEYGYRLSRLVRVGGQVDAEGIFWSEGDFNRNHKLVGTAKQVRNYNLVVMPTVRLEYLHRRGVTLYSGAGAGMLVAWDNDGGSALAPAFNINAIGVELGSGPWTGNIELGAMIALNHLYAVYMLPSRGLSVSVGYAF